jgi:hypothetical protein
MLSSLFAESRKKFKNGVKYRFSARRGAGKVDLLASMLSDHAPLNVLMLGCRLYHVVFVDKEEARWYQKDC